MRAHPRVCGENRIRATLLALPLGSSPRVRGKPPSRQLVPQRERLIPACAGKTAPPTPISTRPRAHPRVCGENILYCGMVLTVLGSSPRVRGKLELIQSGHEFFGLIPACAGKTWGRRLGGQDQRAHPRVCGENVIVPSALETVPGSSPRVRGKQTGTSALDGWGGLIPACAGKTRPGRWRQFQRRAHPRVCGENVPRGKTHTYSAGSSPRVRGKPVRVLHTDGG